ncbi:hypothetical protein SLA2020_362820 [Shorea laevis]
MAEPETFTFSESKFEEALRNKTEKREKQIGDTSDPKPNKKRKQIDETSDPEAQQPRTVKAIRVHKFGGPKVLKLEDVETSEPKEGEICLKLKAAKVCWDSIGIVKAVGTGVTHLKVGNLVYYASAEPHGSCIEERNVPSDKVIILPPEVDPIFASAYTQLAMMARYLVTQVFKVKSGHIVLVHAGGGTLCGYFLSQWASNLGATVIWTVPPSTDSVLLEKMVKAAKGAKCKHVIPIDDQRKFAESVIQISLGRGCDVVYDPIGHDDFKECLACLKPKGHMVNFCSCSGKPKIAVSTLAQKSIFFCSPDMKHYLENRDELIQSAMEVFEKIKRQKLQFNVRLKTFRLSETAQAHSAMEKMETTIAVLVPDDDNGDGGWFSSTI